MGTRNWLRPAATHACALVVGLLVVTPLRPDDGAASEAGYLPQEKSALPSGPELAGREASGRVRAAARPTEHSPSQRFRAAWKNVGYGDPDLSRRERLYVSRQLLREWIREDWRGALDTAMGETPDDFELLEEFIPVALAEPDAFFAVIDGKRYGVLTFHLRNIWRAALSRMPDDQLLEVESRWPEAGAKAVRESR